MPVLSALRSLLKRTAAPATLGLAGAGVMALVAMMAIVTFDVILRYFFNDPTVWAGEVASFMTISVVFLGLGQNMRPGDQIRIDVITSLLARRWQLVLAASVLGADVAHRAVEFALEDHVLLHHRGDPVDGLQLLRGDGAGDGQEGSKQAAGEAGGCLHGMRSGSWGRSLVTVCGGTRYRSSRL